MLDPQEVRLMLLDMLIPQASMYGIQNPETIVEKACVLEKYVLPSAKISDIKPESLPQRKIKKPQLR